MRLIDADYLKQALSSNCKPELCPDYENAWCKTCCPHNDFENIIDDVPTVKTRPRGKWILCQDTYFSRCSICGDIWLNEECKNYCSNCGADMRGEENDTKRT